MPGLLIQPRVQPAGTKQQSNSTRDFEYYINRVSDGKALRMGSCGYHFATKESQPVLKKGQMNRVLIYPGAFNPPHRGHMLVLQHGFRECGEDFNVVAAIVLLKDDSYLSYKNSRSDRELLLTEDERGSLWRTDVQFPDWAWTLTDDQYSSAGDLQEKLTRLASLDGFDVEFIMLLGPDNFSSYEELERDDCYCDRMLISTAARASKDYSHLSGPVKLSNCTVWSPVVPHSEKAKVEAQSPSWLYTDEPSPSPLPAPRQNETRIWECHAHGDIGLSARFLYTPPALPDGEATELVSATAIHNAIMTTTKEESTRYIDNFALGATYLKQQLARRNDGSHESRLELLKAEKALKHLAFEDLKSREEKTCDCEGNKCEWSCNAKFDRNAKRRKEAQPKEAGMAFEDLMRAPLPLEAAQSKKSKQASAGVKEKGAVKKDVDEDSDELDMAFEETIRLRVPMKIEAVTEHKPEYRNANQWGQRSDPGEYWSQCRPGMQERR